MAMAKEETFLVANSENHEPPLSLKLDRDIGSLGLKKRLLHRGTTWQTPFPGDEVEVHYNGHIEDGTSLGSSHDTGSTFKFILGQCEVIKGLDEGVATMKKGEIAIFTIPPHLAYGKNGYLSLVPPNSTLIFEVEMISWVGIRDVTGDGGVIKKIISEGEGWATPKDGDEVTVKYEAKLEDGKIISKSSEEEGTQFHVGDGQLCTAMQTVVKTMRRNEEAEICAKFLYGFGVQEVSQNAECFNTSSNITNTIHLKLVSWRSVKDILGNKKLLKKIITDGEGFDHPNEGSLVKVVYVGKREDGTIFEQNGSLEEPFEYMCLEEQVDEELDRAIISMKKGEKAEIYINSEEVNQTSETTFPNSRLLYEVQLLDFTKEKPFWKMDAQEKINACEKKKQDGNLLFKAGKFWLASNKYEKAVKCIEFNHSFSEEQKDLAKGLLLSCHLNNAACKLKLGEFAATATLCTKVLEVDPDNIKALFRRSQAYQKTSDLDKAEIDIKKALAIDPNNRDIKLELKMLRAKQKEYAMHQNQLFGSMISKMVN